MAFQKSISKLDWESVATDTFHPMGLKRKEEAILENLLDASVRL